MKTTIHSWCPIPAFLREMARCGAALVLFALASPFAHATENITLRWDASPDVNGYRVYYGTTSGVYTERLIVGNTTEASVSNLAEGQTYFFSVTAYNSAAESPRSNEVSFTVPAPTLVVGAAMETVKAPPQTPKETQPPAPSSLNVHDMQAYPLRSGGSVEAAAYARWCRSN